jgi:hypothetical protein
MSTTPPVDPAPAADMKDPDSDGTPAATPPDESDQRGDESPATDPMGIDDDDPIDATLVGAPVDEEGAAERDAE